MSLHSYHTTLGVSFDATDEQIKTAYRKLAKQFHPDKTGGVDADKFVAIQQAYEALVGNSESETDSDKTYNTSSGPGPDSGADTSSPHLGSALFNAVKHIAVDQRRVVGLSLRQFYVGGEYSFVKDDHTAKCTQCRSSMLAFFTSRPACKWCAGTGVCKRPIRITYMVTPGMLPGDTIRVAQAGNVVDLGLVRVSGDLILDLILDKTQEPCAFELYPENSPNDLIVSHDITLLEAMYGFQYNFTHLGGTEVTTNSVPSHIYQPMELMVLPGHGMPLAQHPGLYGNLFVKIFIRMPLYSSFSTHVHRQLHNLLQGIERPNTGSCSDHHPH